VRWVKVRNGWIGEMEERSEGGFLRGVCEIWRKVLKREHTVLWLLEGNLCAMP